MLRRSNSAGCNPDPPQYVHMDSQTDEMKGGKNKEQHYLETSALSLKADLCGVHKMAGVSCRLARPAQA